MTHTRSCNDDGLSLVELIIVVVLLGILGSAIALIFVNSWRAQADVTSTTEATNAGQLVGQSIERAVRNGVAVATDGTALWVKTAYGAGDSRQCQKFWVANGADGKPALFMASAATSAYPSTKEWAEVDGGGPYFNAADPRTVAYSFRLKMVNDNSSSAGVKLSGSVALRVVPGDISPCLP